MDALPFCHRELKHSKPKASGFPLTVKTVGDHIRAHRLELDLFQREVAQILGVDTTTVFNWERMGTTPNLRAWPKILKFLGYDPRPVAETIGARLRQHREGLGLSWAEAAKTMGVDPSTVSKWEVQPDSRQNHISIPAILRFTGHNPFTVPENEHQLVRNVRLLLGLTQREFARKLGVNQQQVSAWENESGNHEIDEQTLTRIRHRMTGLPQFLAK